MSSDDNLPDNSDAPEGPAANLTASRFKKGQSGNPGGRPRSLKAFRTRCRKLSVEILAEIQKRMAAPEVSLADLIRAFEAVSDRGGFLRAETQANIESAHARLALLAMAIKTLTKEQRQGLIDALERELLTGGADGGPG